MNMNIVFANRYLDHRPGDVIEVDRTLGRMLVRDGLAREVAAPPPAELPLDVAADLDLGE